MRKGSSPPSATSLSSNERQRRSNCVNTLDLNIRGLKKSAGIAIFSGRRLLASSGNSQLKVLDPSLLRGNDCVSVIHKS